MKPNNNIKTETVRTRKNDSGRRSRVISLAAAALICLAPYAQGQPAAAVSAISAKYASMGGATGGLGPATSSITGTADGAWYQKYNYGAIYWTAATSAHEVH